jgi:glycosyltransferase involved in cell wall biosynthesis
VAAVARDAEILFISNDASETGAPQSLLTFIRWLVVSRAATPRVILAAPGPLEPAFAALCPVYRTWRGDRPWVGSLLDGLQGVSWRLHRSARMAALSATARKWRPALVYSNTIVTGRETAALSRRSIPVITHVRELDSIVAAVDRSGDLRSTLQRTDRFVANSEATKRNLVERYAVPAQRVDVVYPFVDIGAHSYGEPVAAVRQRLGLPVDARLFVGCGTLHPRKGTDLFVEVAAAMKALRGNEPFAFVWVGSDTTQMTRDGMTRRAAELGLSQIVSFAGHRRDYLDFLRAADLFLLTSREEPFGRVVLEAALFGTPTVCFADCGGAAEFVRDDAGRAVPMEDVQAMARAAIDLIDSPSLREALGIRARERVRSRHSIEAGAPRLWDLIERTIVGGRA